MVLLYIGRILGSVSMETFMIDIASLQQYSLFGGMLPEQIEKIQPLLIQSSYSSGEIVLKEGAQNDRIYFILDGRVEVTKGDCVLSELGEGDAFGEMELLDVLPSAATIRALSPLRVAAISNHAVHQIYCMDPKVFALMIMNLARDLSRRLRRMDEIAAELIKNQKTPCPSLNPKYLKPSKTPSLS